jgi:hypothetical protein
LGAVGALQRQEEHIEVYAAFGVPLIPVVMVQIVCP